ncbi:MAG: hypothetical protein AVDCRST_MAG01-01-2552 [uncultured Rubrobacteraceae bacterium]|uniref:Uncharacterized protein n=1 Tax=uncultured Rubrobacteraceae bacterium TaxID=349277 RepID=A0A6J4PV37_9ACTN|nr:MAG: hypothetical protein AVDCRST_MAG01-01-2552 [uncultured Rubrobacteraceae bacterium]
MLLAATTAIVAVLAVGMASADPVNSKNAQILTFDCGGEEVTVATLFNNRAVVFNVVDTTGNFVITRVEGTATFTEPETGEMVKEEFVEPIGKGKKRGLGRSLTTCDTTFSIENPELGTITLDLTFTGFFTPRRG